MIVLLWYRKYGSFTGEKTEKLFRALSWNNQVTSIQAKWQKLMTVLKIYTQIHWEARLSQRDLVSNLLMIVIYRIVVMYSNK